MNNMTRKYSMLLTSLISLGCATLILQLPVSQTVNAVKGAYHSVAPYDRSTADVVPSFSPGFEANQGQVDNKVKFLARGSGYTLFLTPGEMVLSLRRKPPAPETEGHGTAAALDKIPDLSERFRSRFPGIPAPAVQLSQPRVVRIRLEGASASAKVVGLEQLPGKVNYIIGNDPGKWRTNISTYARVKYSSVYPGIDLVYYDNQRRLEHDFILAPGSDPNRIELAVDGGDEIEVDARGNLLLDRRGGLFLKRPTIYQQCGKVRTEIAGSYEVRNGHHVGFRVAAYDSSLPLVIDPILLYSTYLGGSGDDTGVGIAVDSVGNAYVVGRTYSINFPTADPLQARNAAGSEVFVTKLRRSGEALVYSTYIGGGNNDYGEGIAVDAAGCAYVVGSTYSGDFPTTNPLQARPGGGSYDAFITKLNASGNGLVYSTYLGGASGDSGYGVALDNSENVYITGRTFSDNFPTANPFQQKYAGQGDAFVAKLNVSGNVLVYSTYLGGTGAGSDWGWGIAVDSVGSAYVAGSTYSYNFPTVNPVQAGSGGSEDAFVTKLSPAGNSLAYSTCLGGAVNDSASGIALDLAGNAYVTGYTVSGDFPTARALQSRAAGSYDAFVTKVNPSGTELVYSTYLGGSGDDFANGIAVDSDGNAHVTGYTDSTNFPRPGAIQSSYGGGIGDAFVTKLNPSGSAIVYSTYLGGSGTEAGAIGERDGGIAVDAVGNTYVVGRTSSINFPTANPLQSNYGGGTGFWADDAFVAKISSLYSALELKVPEGGAGSRSTAGTGDSTQVGYAAGTVTAGTPPYGLAVFSFTQNGVVVSEAAVPASPPTTRARVFVDYRSRVAAIPGRSDAGAVDINTGIAVVNTGAAAANVTYTLRGPSGITLATGHGSLAVRAHFAKFVDQLKEAAPDFSIPGDFSTRIQFGSLDIAGDQPLSILALRLTTNQRNDALLTSTPIADLTSPLGTDTLYFPQFVDGGGYVTALMLLNTSGSLESGKLFLFRDDGAPLEVNQVGGTRDSAFSYSIPQGGVFVFETDGFPADVNAGSVQVVPDVATSSPVGTGVFSLLQGGVRVTESGVPSASPTTHARIYIDQSGSHGTGLAIASPGSATVSVTLKAFRTDGRTPAGTGPAVSLSGNGHTARFVSELLSGLPANFTGILDISSSSTFVALTLRSSTNSRNDFLLTTFPIADVTREAPTQIVFPQIADGGGYVTEFILLGARGASAVTLGFSGNDGKPLLLPLLVGN